LIAPLPLCGRSAGMRTFPALTPKSATSIYEKMNSKSSYWLTFELFSYLTMTHESFFDVLKLS
jgi:hypothetical protein